VLLRMLLLMSEDCFLLDVLKVLSFV